MLLGIDHIVIAVSDLAAATRDYRRLGFTVVPGGRHPVGSYNSLIAFADGSYIELISFYRDSPDHRWWAALKKGEGLVDFCMRTDDLTGDTAKFRNAGVTIDDPVPWSRKRPDGYQLRWLLSLARDQDRGVVPFLIQDETPREERVPRETDHDNGIDAIRTIIVAVIDPSEAKRSYETVVGREGVPLEKDDIGAVGFCFEIGPHRVELVTPTLAKSPVNQWLQARGPSPFAAILHGAKKAPPMDLSLTHGAALWLE